MGKKQKGMARVVSNLSDTPSVEIPVPVLPAVEAGRHPWFYFEDGTIVLKIRLVLFKVHRHFLTEYSPVFKDMWTIGSLKSKDGEGSSDDNPISLNGDDPGDFACLLQIFYHKSPGSAVSFSAIQWRSVLAIATKYDMEIIRGKAIQELRRVQPPLDPVDQIVAARKYDCTELADAAMEVLVKRTALLTIEEMVRLSPEDLHNWILQRNKPGCGNCGYYY